MNGTLNKTGGVVAVRAEADTAEALVAKINNTFSAFKEKNEERLAEIEAKMGDVLTVNALDAVSAELNALNERYDAVVAQNAAREIGGNNLVDNEFTKCFENWMRTGDSSNDREMRAKLKTGEFKASLSIGVDEDGGYAAPVEWDRTVTDQLIATGQMRQYASVQVVSGQGFKKLYNKHGATSGWVGETSDRPETNTPKLSEYSFAFGEIYANPRMTERSLEDPAIDLAAWLASEVNLEFQVQEGNAFISGNGVNKPKGLLEYTAAKELALDAAGRHPLGPIKEVKSGKASSFDQDSLIKLAYDLPQERSIGAAYYAARNTIAAIRLLKDADGRYIWQPPFQAGQPALVNGTPIRELDGMGSHSAAGEIAVAYGNMEMTYRVFDRLGTTVMRDPYTAKPYVTFYTRKRVGGGVWNPEYMRFMTIGA